MPVVGKLVRKLVGKAGTNSCFSMRRASIAGTSGNWAGGGAELDLDSYTYGCNQKNADVIDKRREAILSEDLRYVIRRSRSTREFTRGLSTLQFGDKLVEQRRYICMLGQTYRT